MGEEDTSNPFQTYANCGILLLQSKGSCLPIASTHACGDLIVSVCLLILSLREQVIVSKLVLPDLNGWSLGHHAKRATIDLVATKHR